MLILVATQDRPEVSLEEWIFLEKIFRIPLQERTWKELVTLATIHRYCEGPEPTDIGHRYDRIARKHESIAFRWFILQYFIFCPHLFFSLPAFAETIC